MNDQRKDMLEIAVAQRFVEALDEGWELLPREGTQSLPDFRLRRGDQVVGLELARYREQDARNYIADLDAGFQHFVLDHWIDDPTVHHCGLCLIYRRAENRIVVPQPSERPRVLAELQQLVRELERPAAPAEYRFELYDSDDQAYLNFVARHRGPILDKRRFPALCRFFSLVVIHWHPDIILGLPHTSGSSGCTGADTAELTRVISDKAKRAPEYRRGLPDGAELWLLVYNEGWPATAHVANEMILGRLLECARSELASHAAFDRAFWLKDAYVRPTGPLMEIDRRGPVMLQAG